MCRTSSICTGPFAAELRKSSCQLLTKLIGSTDTLLLLQDTLRVDLSARTLWTAMGPAGDKAPPTPQIKDRGCDNVLHFQVPPKFTAVFCILQTKAVPDVSFTI